MGHHFPPWGFPHSPCGRCGCSKCQVSPCHSWPPTDPHGRESHPGCLHVAPHVDSLWLSVGVPWDGVLSKLNTGCNARDHLSQCQTWCPTSLSPILAKPLASFTLIFKIMSLTSPHLPPKVYVNLSCSLIWLLVVLLFSVICLGKTPLRQPCVFHSSIVYSYFQSTPTQTVLPKRHHMNSPAVLIQSVWNITKFSHLPSNTL